MMLYKPIVSLLVALAAASSATASVTPSRRGGNGGYPPPPATPVPDSQCATAKAQCCREYTSSSNPEVAPLAILYDLILNVKTGVGLGCTQIVGGSCNSNAVCCTNVTQKGLINVGCSPLI